MSGYIASPSPCLMNAAGAVVGIVGIDGREWLFPAAPTAGPDGATIAAFTEILYDSTNTPQGFLANGIEYVFAAPFTSNTLIGLVAGWRPTLLAATGQPLGVKGGSSAWVFPVPPTSGGGAPAGVTVTITTQLDAARIIQRTTSTGGGQGKGQGSVAMALSFTGTQPVYCRRRSFSDGTTIVQAPWLANASATTGTITLTGIDAPAFNSSGAPVAAADGWSYLDVATSSAGPWTSATSKMQVGRLVLYCGQSLAVRMIGAQDGQQGTVTNATQGITPSPYASILATYNETRAYLPTVATMPWAPPADGGNYDSLFASTYLNLQIATFGVATGIIGHARGAQALSVFLPAGSEGIQLAAVVARAGGAYEDGIWYQGHTEAGFGVPPNGYATGLAAIFASFAAMNSRAIVGKYVGSIPNIDNALWGTPFCRNWIRGGHDAWATANGAVHVQANDIPQVDGVHQNQVGNIALAQHFHRASRTTLGLHGDAGPALVSATRVGTTITAVFSDVGQGNLVLTGTPGNRIYVFPTGAVDTQGTSNNRFPVSTVSVVDRKTLLVTLANDPGDANVLDLRLYWPNELGTTMAQTDTIRDDIVDGDGITVGRQVLPNYTALTIAAPGSGATNAPPGGLVAGTSQYTLPTSSPTFGASVEAGFGQTFSGGTALSVSSKEATFAPISISARFTYLGAPAATQVLVGGFGNFLALTTTGKLNFGGTGATALVVGHNYHVMAQGSSAGHAIYLTDLTAATPGVRDYSDATAMAIVAPGAVNIGLRNLNGGNVLLNTTAAMYEAALFDTLVYAGTSYTAPTAPYTGKEANIRALWHLNGDVTEAIVR